MNVKFYINIERINAMIMTHNEFKMCIYGTIFSLKLNDLKCIKVAKDSKSCRRPVYFDLDFY